MRIFFQVFSLPWGSLRGIFEWINVKKRQSCILKFQFFLAYFLHCSVSFLFLLKRCQINGFLAEISNRKQTEKFPRKLHLSSPPHRWHCICKIGQCSHWSHWVCTITSLYEDVILWYWPLPQRLEIPPVQLPAQPLPCNPSDWRQDDFVTQIITLIANENNIKSPEE